LLIAVTAMFAIPFNHFTHGDNLRQPSLEKDHVARIHRRHCGALVIPADEGHPEQDKLVGVPCSLPRSASISLPLTLNPDPLGFPHTYIIVAPVT
jgi:hypothetical protein